MKEKEGERAEEDIRSNRKFPSRMATEEELKTEKLSQVGQRLIGIQLLQKEKE